MDIRVESVSKTYGLSPALHGIDLNIASGELLGLLGPSGSGKTTLLRIIAGLEIPNSGKVLFGQEDASAWPIQQRRVGFVFQHYALFKHMNVIDNIAYGLRVRPRAERPSETEISQRVSELLDLVQLGSFGARYPAQLSGGQRQRVALARALAVEPKVLLLDEPFGALDAKVRKDLRRWLREIHDCTGHTTVFVTHDQEEALELSDRIAVLDKGRIEQLGSPDDIYDRPATPFVFGFIGESGRLPLTILNGKAIFENVALPIDATGLVDGAAQLFVRPQDVELAENGMVHGVVTSHRRAGAIRRVEVRLGTHGAVLEADIAAGTSVTTGAPTGLRFKTVSIFAADGRVQHRTFRPEVPVGLYHI